MDQEDDDRVPESPATSSQHLSSEEREDDMEQEQEGVNGPSSPSDG